MTERAPSNADIMRALGRLEEGVGRLRIDHDAQVLHARENDRLLFDKLDDQAKLIGVAAEVAGQARDKVSALEVTMTDIKPTVDNFRTMQKVGVGIVGLLGIGGLSIGAAMAWVGDAVAHWLGSLFQRGP